MDGMRNLWERKEKIDKRRMRGGKGKNWKCREKCLGAVGSNTVTQIFRRPPS